MSVQERRKYDPDFKRNAVKLTKESGRTVAAVAENLGKRPLFQIKKLKIRNSKSELKNCIHNIKVWFVARHMKEMGLKCRTMKKFVVTTDSKHNNPVAPNLLNRQFTVPAPDIVYVMDIT